MHFLRQFSGVFFTQSVAHALRGSVLFAAFLLLLTSTGSWKYFGSTVTAHEMQRSAAWAPIRDVGDVPVFVAIDDYAYENFFHAESPVSRDSMLALLKTVSEHTRPSTRVVIDIDVSPVPGQAEGQRRLEGFLLQAPGKWVLPAVQSGDARLAATLAKWRNGLCASGIDFGLPYIPNEFGYPKLTHQYQHSLADAATGRGACADPAAARMQKAMPLQASYLKSGLIIPFSGDLVLLAALLDSIGPTSVVLGGAWGQTDVFATPFGDRYGAQVHAAALAGSRTRERLAPSWLEVLVSWTFVSLISTILFYLSQFLSRHTDTAPASMVGHAFFSMRLKPILMFIIVSGSFLLLVELLAVLHAFSGLWINTTKLGGYMAVWFVISSNLGRSAVAPVKNWKTAFRGQILSPLRADLGSVLKSAQVVFNRSSAWPSTGWTDAGAAINVSRPRAAFEGSCALVSLLMQSAVPVASLAYIFYKTF